MRLANHVDLFPEAHVRPFQLHPEPSVDQPHCREVVDARKAQRVELLEQIPHLPHRVGAHHPGDHRHVLDDWQHLALAHILDDLIGIAKGEHPGETAVAGHAVTTGVVDDDQVRAADLGKLGRDAGAGAGSDDWLALSDLGAQAFEYLFSGVAHLVLHSTPPGRIAGAAARPSGSRGRVDWRAAVGTRRPARVCAARPG